MIIAGIENNYLNTETSEKVYTKLGKCFRTLSSKTQWIIEFIYELISSDKSFQLYLRSILRHVGFTQTLYDENLWVIKKEGSFLVHLSFYIDGILISSI